MDENRPVVTVKVGSDDGHESKSISLFGIPAASTNRVRKIFDEILVALAFI